MSKTKRLALLGVCASLCMVMSYIELLLPPVFAAVPGIKLGLANIIIIYLLYTLGVWDAVCVSAVRVLLSALLFGSAVTLAYSLAGAVLSLTVMTLLRKAKLFSTVGVSISGAVMHNLGQILVAIALLGTREIGYYMIPLTVSGIIAGIAVGIAGALLIKRIRIR